MSSSCSVGVTELVGGSSLGTRAWCLVDGFDVLDGLDVLDELLLPGQAG